MPAPPVKEIEHRLRQVLTPGTFAAARMDNHPTTLRERVLTLPVMTAVVVSLVWRQVPSLSEVLRMLEREGLLGLAPRRVSKQALSQRLQKLPAELFAQVFDEAIARLQAQSSLAPVPEEWAKVRSRFTVCWAGDGSTLEALRKKLSEIKGSAGTTLGGKMMVLVDLFTHRPLKAWYTTDAQANDKTFCEKLVESLPKGGLWVFDLGFFSFELFDTLTDAGKYFITRMREKTAYRVVETLGEGAKWRDEIVKMGVYRSHPCQHRVRMVSVLWGTKWYRYITNVMETERLSAQEVSAVYRQRWRVEDAFLLTKRLLGLSYLWVGSRNGVEIQIYATWIFYAVLTDLCAEVAQALGEPLSRISTEMVFRSLYHFSRAIERGENPELISFLVKDAKLFGLVKAERKRHREQKQLIQETWEVA